MAMTSWLQAAPRAGEDGDAIAIVNGHSIARREVVELLMESHGLAALQQLIVLELAKQETKRRGLVVGAEDVRSEYEQSVERIAREVFGETKTTDAERLRGLETVLERKGLTIAEFMVGMERNAHLRKLANQDLKLDERLIREEFARQYGEKVEIRHIQLADADDVARATAALEGGEGFAEVARRMSRNAETAAKGGLLPAFAFNDESIPPLMREAAFQLKPLEVSTPLRIENAFHLIRLERRIPPAAARFEDQRESVERALRERIVSRLMADLATELFRKSSIRVLDPRLKEEFEALKSAGRSPGQP